MCNLIVSQTNAGGSPTNNDKSTHINTYSKSKPVNIAGLHPVLWMIDHISSIRVFTLLLLLLGGKLLAERCRSDDLMPSIPVLCLPPSRVDPKVLGLNVLVYHSQQGGSWTTRRSPPIRWWSQRGGDDTVVVLLWSWLSQVPEKPQSERLYLFRDWQAAGDAPDCYQTIAWW